MNQYPPVKSTVAAIASLYWVRMMGLFMVLPVLSIYAGQYQLATPMLIAMAIGIYGLTQGLLQIPLGMLSDRIGRLPVLFMGFTLFAVGSVTAAISESIWGLIAGRALQGAGAVAGVLMALLADTTSEKVRTPAMAGVGASIGLAFAIAMVLSPWLASTYGISSVFWFSAGVGVLSIVLLATVVARPKQNNQRIQLADLSGLLSSPKLVVGYSGIFVVHLLLMVLFVVVPQRLVAQTGLEVANHSWIYLGAMFAGFVGMVPMMILAERRKRHTTAFMLGAVMLGGAVVWASLAAGYNLIGAIVLFFIGFNALEALLPSYVSKAAPVQSKGTVMSIFATSQFIGTFIGAVIGGSIIAGASGIGVVTLIAALPVVWATASIILIGRQQWPAEASIK